MWKQPFFCQSQFSCHHVRNGACELVYLVFYSFYIPFYRVYILSQRGLILLDLFHGLLLASSSLIRRSESRVILSNDSEKI